MATIQKELAKAEKEKERAIARLARIRDENEETIDSATRTAMVMGGALAMAWWKGRYPDKSDILGIDASLVVGGGLAVASIMGWAGDQELVVESLGNGALASFAVSKGLEFGNDARLKAAA